MLPHCGGRIDKIFKTFADQGQVWYEGSEVHGESECRYDLVRSGRSPTRETWPVRPVWVSKSWLQHTLTKVFRLVGVLTALNVEPPLQRIFRFALPPPLLTHTKKKRKISHPFLHVRVTRRFWLLHRYARCSALRVCSCRSIRRFEVNAHRHMSLETYVSIHWIPQKVDQRKDTNSNQILIAVLRNEVSMFVHVLEMTLNYTSKAYMGIALQECACTRDVSKIMRNV